MRRRASRKSVTKREFYVGGLQRTRNARDRRRCGTRRTSAAQGFIEYRGAVEEPSSG